MKRPCLYPACRALLDKGRYCPDHAASDKQYQKNADQRRLADPITAMAAKFRWTKEWQRARRRKLIANPLCEDPHGYHGKNTATATQVHHIHPLATHYHLRTHVSNLMSLCSRCHDVFNRQERKESEP